ncbi:Tigger transposable element-derived protein 1 [Eumeta japonica]|uniref:Tigger transposable element-derived protein 1 n=1 Tax=Eumeta variegata TaxID=151549 RepID=A0A4C1VFY0_EUMVA|nr:Tigger transposable element-derived protein 1 [Eumeta japonica]
MSMGGGGHLLPDDSHMPRINISPKPKRKRQQWDPEKMKLAVQAVQTKAMGYKKAVKMFSVPRTTLRRLAKCTGESLDSVVHRPLGRKCVLPPEIEKELVEYLLFMESKYYGLLWIKPTGTSYARVQGFNRAAVNEFFDILEAEYSKKHYPADRIFNVDETGLTIVQSKIPAVIGKKGKRQIGALTAAERGSLVTLVCCMSAGGSYIPPMLIFPRKNYSDQLMKGAPPGAIGKVHPSGWIQAHLFTEWFKHFLEKTNPTEQSPVLLVLDGHYTHTRNIEILTLARERHVTIICLPPHTTHKLQPLDQTFMGALKTHYSNEIRQFMLHSNRILKPYDIAELLGKAYLKCTTGENWQSTDSESQESFRLIDMCLAMQIFWLKSCHVGSPSILSNEAHTSQANLSLPPLGQVSVSPLVDPTSASAGILAHEAPVSPSQPNLSAPVTQPLRTIINQAPVSATIDRASDDRSIQTKAAHVTPSQPNLSPSANHPLPPLEQVSVSPLVDSLSVIASTLAHETPAPSSQPNPSDSQPGPSSIRSRAILPADILPAPSTKKMTSNRGRKAGTASVITSSPYKRQLEDQIQRSEDVKRRRGLRGGRGRGRGHGRGRARGRARGHARGRGSGRTATQRGTQRNEFTDSEDDDDQQFDGNDSSSGDDVPLPQYPNTSDTECIFCNAQFSNDTRGEIWIKCQSCDMWAHNDCAGAEGDYYVCDFCR